MARFFMLRAAVFAAAIVALPAGTGITADAEERIAYAHTSHIFDTLAHASGLHDAVMAEFDADEAALIQLEGEIAANLDRRIRNALTMTDEQITALESTIAAQRAKFRNDAQALEVQQADRFEQARAELLRAIGQEIERVRDEEGYTFVLSSETVLAGPEGRDLTADIIARMNTE